MPSPVTVHQNGRNSLKIEKLRGANYERTVTALGGRVGGNAEQTNRLVNMLLGGDGRQRHFRQRFRDTNNGLQLTKDRISSCHEQKISTHDVPDGDGNRRARIRLRLILGHLRANFHKMTGKFFRRFLRQARRAFRLAIGQEAAHGGNIHFALDGIGGHSTRMHGHDVLGQRLAAPNQNMSIQGTLK